MNETPLFTPPILPLEIPFYFLIFFVDKRDCCFDGDSTQVVSPFNPNIAILSPVYEKNLKLNFHRGRNRNQFPEKLKRKSILRQIITEQKKTREKFHTGSPAISNVPNCNSLSKPVYLVAKSCDHHTVVKVGATQTGHYTSAKKNEREKNSEKKKNGVFYIRIRTYP